MVSRITSCHTKHSIIGTVPQDWLCITLHDVCAGNLQTGPFGSQLHADEYVEEGISVLMPKDLVNYKAIAETASKITHDRAQSLAKHRLEVGDLLFSRRGDVSRFALINFASQGALCGTGCLRARPSKEHSPFYISYVLQLEAITDWLEQNAVGQTMPNMNTTILASLPLVVPAYKEEQQRIAAILTAVDDKLDVIARQITATQVLKQGLMQTLFTKGVGTQDAEGRWVPHADFKESDVGVIPAPWLTSAIGNALSVVERPVVMQDDKLYRRVTVKRRHGGVELRDELPGAEIKVKSQFELEADDFLISERQIVHGACGIVPARLAGALVSNEYLVLCANAHVDVSYVNYLVQLLKYSKLFMLCAQGVDIEKFLFKPKDWLKKLIPLPPLHEQQRIAQILSAMEEKIAALEARHAQYKTLKRGLMQKLLTGVWRVKVDPTHN